FTQILVGFRTDSTQILVLCFDDYWSNAPPIKPLQTPSNPFKPFKPFKHLKPITPAPSNIGG
ncbi:MAG TPA: hypothetical protein VK168_01025, partial [Saprospiraceae bacterium]|nr:hypothetical protein [Saprospiraceae bacterium]